MTLVYMVLLLLFGGFCFMLGGAIVAGKRQDQILDDHQAKNN